VKRGAYRSLIVLVIALSLLTSGCFQIRSFIQKPKVLANGEVGKVYLQLYQVSQAEFNTDGYTFILIGYESADLSIKLVGDFDTKGNYGGPFDAVRDDELRDWLLTSPNCAASGIDAADITGMTWRAYRTADLMDSTAGGYDEPMTIQFRLKRKFLDAAARGDFVVFSGTAIQISGDIAGSVCAGMVFSSFSGAEV